ncbi:MAG TPA: LPS assembly lipoprotein LptE [Archangium sp.]
MRRALALVLVLAGCGYRVTAPNASLPGGVRAVRVPVFDNRTAEPGVELAFTQAAKDQLARAGRLGDGDAEARLDGSILSIGGGPFLSSSALPRYPVFRLSASVSLTLTREGRTLGSTVVTVTEEFPSGADVLQTEANRAQALRRLADAALREGLERLQSP